MTPTALNCPICGQYECVEPEACHATIERWEREQGDKMTGWPGWEGGKEYDDAETALDHTFDEEF